MIFGRHAILVAALFSVAPAAAEAQSGVPGARFGSAGVEIYTWRDASGNLVLSDRPKDPSAQTYRIARA